MSELDLANIKIVLSPAPTETKGARTSYKTATYRTIEQVAANTKFDLAIPGAPLAGHELLDGAVISEPASAAALTYVERGTGRHYVLVQSPIVATDGASKPAVNAVGDAVSRTSVGGVEAALITSEAPGAPAKPMTLMWNRNGLLIQVTGMGYSQSDLQNVAEGIA